MVATLEFVDKVCSEWDETVYIDNLYVTLTYTSAFDNEDLIHFIQTINSK